MPRPRKIARIEREPPDAKTAQQQLVDGAVKPGTLTGYRGKVKQVVDFVRGLRRPGDNSAITCGEFLQFAAVAQDSGLVDISGFRSAMLHLQLSGEDAGLPLSDGSWRADDALVCKAAKGATYRAGKKSHNAPPPRGAITAEMVAQLIRHVCNTHPQLRLPLTIMFFAALRPGELVLLHSGDLSGDELLIRSNKRRKASNREPPTYSKRLACVEAIEALQQASAAVKVGDPLWTYGRLTKGGWCRDDLCKVIKAARQTLGWPEGLTFVPHSLRHGGTSEIVERSDPQDLPRTTQMSRSTRARYTKPNTLRK